MSGTFWTLTPCGQGVSSPAGVIHWCGVPSLIQHVASGGHWPRVFALLDDERQLVVGNERSGSLAVFRIAADGRLAPTGETLSVPGVVFLGRPD